MHTDKKELIEEAINLMNKTGSIEFCRQISKDVVVNAWRRVRDSIPESRSKQDLFNLAIFCVDRNI